MYLWVCNPCHRHIGTKNTCIPIWKPTNFWFFLEPNAICTMDNFNCIVRLKKFHELWTSVKYAYDINSSDSVFCERITDSVRLFIQYEINQIIMLTFKLIDDRKISRALTLLLDCHDGYTSFLFDDTCHNCYNKTVLVWIICG